MFSRRIDYICKYNNLCAEKDMSKSKLYAWILSILGLQLQSCFPFSALEYGCQYTEFKTNGTVKDEKGRKWSNTKVNIKIDVYDTNGDIALTSERTVTSDQNGKYESKYGECDFTKAIGKIEYEITSSPSYPYYLDTIRKEVESENIKVTKKGEDKTISQEIDIILKREKKE